MSFITKRERVFNDYDLYDLPGRNEGKLKAYASCTDARAWSHFGSDKSEHLVEVIKRNNEVCRPKYVPTEAIVNTLLAHKQAEIARLKRKIEEFEQIVAAYDDLDLSCEQKCEIAKAHAAIKEANKELNELWFDLDLSGYTGVDSEGFETGKSRGDEPSKRRLDDGEETPRSKGDEGEGDEMMGDEWLLIKESKTKSEAKDLFLSGVLSKGIQAGGATHISDAYTNVIDPRIQDMQDLIITKDAKLNAMRNTYAVIENDVSEPYYIYAHIYTALVKIFGILCQNDKYKLYLNLMTAGKDTRNIDIKGKILFKLKVLEKFSLALIAPCSREMQGLSEQECSCYRAEVISGVETAYALTSSETQKPIDTKRTQLVADIMENEEMIELLNKDLKPDMEDEDVQQDYFDEAYSIDQENFKRLKDLQQSFDDLMSCYEALKHEKDCLLIRCRKYEDLEIEFAKLQTQLREYNSLWNEKEHYRKRSIDLDALKEQYLVLCDETTGLETELKAENQINEVKSKVIDELRSDNLSLEKQLNEATIAFEKEQNCAQCKLKESECTIMCQGQQIKSLSIQIDKLLEQDPDKVQFKHSEVPVIAIIDEINSLKEQIKNLQDALYCSEEEKQQLQDEYQNKLNLINDLKIKIEDWKSNYEKSLQRNDYFEEYTNSFQEELHKLIKENKTLSQEVNDKTNALDNLLHVLENKSQEVNKLMEEIEQKNNDNSNLFVEINNLRETYNKSVTALDSEKLLEKVKDYNDIINHQKNVSHLYEKQTEECNQLKALLNNAQQENKSLQIDLNNQEKYNSTLLQEIQRLQEVNSCVINDISSLQEDSKRYKMSLELNQKDSSILLENRLCDLENLSHQFELLKESHENLLIEKCRLEKDLLKKTFELDSATHDISLTKKESQELEIKLKESENFKANFERVENAYQILVEEQNFLKLKLEDKSSEIDNLHNKLEMKIEENRDLSRQLRLLELHNRTVQSNIASLQEEHSSTNNILNDLRTESDALMGQIKFYKAQESNYDTLKKEYDQMVLENSELSKELEKQEANLRKNVEDNLALNSESQHLLSYSEDLERALINARNQLTDMTSSSDDLYEGIRKQIEEMRKEKNESAVKIRHLLDKLDESENALYDLSEIVRARDDKITVLENHINKLQDEVKRLHESLAEMIYTGEQIKDLSLQKITESLDTMEAHHSKATHNMKMELAKLQTDNIKLGEHLSISKIENDESSRDKNKYISQTINLRNEKEIIVTEIKELELKSVGDSDLSPKHCNIEDVLGSLDRIRRYIDARSSKSTSLEQTLLKVQSSYQIVQSKADEAKKIVEKEKEKILSEKEEAIRDRINMEKQLSDLKEQLEIQVSRDKNVIKDLEAEILNQKLISDQLNRSTQSYVSKLKEEIQSLKELYQKSLDTVSELQKRIHLVTDENNTHLDIIDKVNNKLKEQSNDIDLLKKDLESLKNVPRKNFANQAFITNSKNDETQTTEELFYEGYELYEDADRIKDLYEKENRDKSGSLEKKIIHIDKPKHLNEIQVLVANVEPTFNYDKNSYLNFKIKHLSPGRLEQYSISGTSQNGTELDTKGLTIISVIDKSVKKSANEQSIENMNVIDIYNKQSLLSSSSKIIDSNYANEERDSKNHDKSSVITDFGMTDESFKTKSMNETNDLFGSVSGVSTDKDLFVIYKDSDTNGKSNDKKTWSIYGHSELLVETATIHPDRYNAKSKRKLVVNENDVFSYQEDDELMEDDSVKHKLKINLPRVDIDSPAIDISSDGERKSLDSYTIVKASLSSNETQFVDSNSLSENNNLLSFLNNNSNRSTSVRDQANDIKNENTNLLSTMHNKKFEDDSHYTLSRTNADVYLIKNQTNHAEKIDLNWHQNIYTKHNNNVGLLDDIHATADNINSYDVADALRKTCSDKVIGQIKSHTKINSNLSKYNELKKGKAFNINESSFIIQPKVYLDREVMVKLDPTEEYETQIRTLTGILENIEKDYKKKIEVIKIQYDTNIKNILNEHNEGVKSIQGLHEDTLHDIIKHHENEVENLRSMSIEAMRKADKLEKEVRSLKYKIPNCGSTCTNENPTKIAPDMLKQRQSRVDTKTLTKTNVETFNVRPKSRSSGPCACSLDINLSDTIRNIFEQVDLDQRKVAEQMYLKYIANKMLSGTVEALDCQELSFLHLKVCRIWKLKLSKEETLQKRITSLEAEVIVKQKHNQHNIAELDRQVAEERRRLQEVREAVCRNTATGSQYTESGATNLNVSAPNSLDVEYSCFSCNPASCSLNIGERKSAGDLCAVPAASGGGTLRQKRGKPESNRAVLAKLDGEERRARKLYNDEPPTRLRRPHDRYHPPPARPNKK